MFPTSKSGPAPGVQRKEHNERNERNEQWPLGPHPSSDDVLDAAVEYTFPASDPIAAGCAEKLAEREQKRRGSPQVSRDKPSSR